MVSVKLLQQSQILLSSRYQLYGEDPEDIITDKDDVI